MSQRLIIVGAGGHAKVVAETAQLAGYSIVGFVDHNPDLQGHCLLGLPVLGDERALARDEYSDCFVVIAIGDNRDRENAARRLAKQGPQYATIVHPSAVLSSSAKLGIGSVVFAGAVVNSSATIGEHCILNTQACVEHDCVIDSFVHVSPGACLAGGCRIGR